MPRARAFFYVSAGILLLALSHHLGARSATAQALGFRVLGENGPFIAVGESVYEMDYYGWQPVPPGSPGGDVTLPPVPVSSLVLYLGGQAITQTGEGWIRDGNTGVWHSVGTPPGVTPAQRQTFGQLKSDYRK